MLSSSFSKTVPQHTEHTSFLSLVISISQGMVATHLRYGGIFSDCFITNFLKDVLVVEFRKFFSIYIKNSVA